MSCSPGYDRKQPHHDRIAKTQTTVKRAPYKVRGKRYKPMTVHQALRYETTGYASWYGKGRRAKTASGEVINPHTSLSAAHTTLPMPCKVQVTHLATGKSVVVRINDRGPFVRNREIDLTTHAAKQLGMHRHGIAKVKVKVLSVGDGEHEIFAPTS